MTSADYILPGLALTQYIARSVLGLVVIYNRLPADIVESSKTVKDFQTKVQQLMKQRACQGHERWACIFSPRWALHNHPPHWSVVISACRTKWVSVLVSRVRMGIIA